MNRTFILLILAVFLNNSVHPQNYTVRNYTTKDGLPHNNIRFITKDSTGFLWFATWDGLSRFDGYEFKNYHHIPGDSTSLPFFTIRTVVLDCQNNLWVLTDDGSVARFNRGNDNFTTILKPKNRSDVILSLMSDMYGNIWCLKYDCFLKKDRTGINFKRYEVSIPAAMMDPGAFLRANMLNESDSVAWLVDDHIQKIKIDNRKQKISVLKSIQLFPGGKIPGPVIRSNDHHVYSKPYMVPGKSIFIFSSAGLFEIDTLSDKAINRTENPPLSELSGTELFCWGSQDGYIFIYDSQKNIFLKIPPEEAQLPKQVFAYNKNTLWVASSHFTGNPGGLTRIILTPDYFKLYNVEAGADRLPAVYSIAKDRDNNLWMGIRGLDHLLVVSPDGKKHKIRNAWSSDPSYGPVRAIKPVYNGIWFGYFSNLLLFYDYNSRKFTRYDVGLSNLRTLHVGKDGLIYAGDFNLKVLDPVTGKKESYGDPSEYLGLFIIKPGADGKIWGGMSLTQIFSYDPEKKEFRIMRQSQATYNTEDVIAEKNGTVWMALLGGGVVNYNPHDSSSTVYTTANGLSNNTVYSLLKDSRGNIWASTDNGISKINPSTGIIKNYGVNEGLSIIEFNSGASFIDSDSIFYFGGMGGAVSFNPRSVTEYSEEPANQKILLTELIVSGRTKNLHDDINNIDTLILDKGENDIHLGFSSADFSHSDETAYRFRLEKEEREWTVRDRNNRNINYSNLSPGFYTILISATNTKGEWINPKRLVIRVTPYFWQTLFFKIFVALTVFGIFHLIISLYLWNFRQKERQKQDELRLQALRGQMNPHFIFNSLNSINYFISRNDKISANRYISDFSRLIRSILSNMGSSYVKFRSEISSIRDYLEIEHLRFGDKFDFELITNELEETPGLEVFPGLVQPFIENAIWHGVRPLEHRKGTIRVVFSEIKNGMIQCIIEDDGIGRKASSVLNKGSALHNSMGISIVNERLNIISKLRGLSYHLTISDINPDAAETGTRILIQIPSRFAY